jgi:Carbohydrate binding module (family 6)
MAFALVVVFAAPARAATPVEMQFACALKSNGLLRYVADLNECKQNETQVAVKPGPRHVCVQPGGSSRLVSGPLACPPSRRLVVLPPQSGVVYFCAAIPTGGLRHVTDPTQCTASENPVFVAANNTPPTVVVNAPVEGGTFAFGNNIPFTVTVTDPEDGTVNCAEVFVTFVLGHDTHGHAQETTTGCSGVLHTDADDVFHGGNVFGVVSARYTDHGGPGGAPPLTTVEQTAIRQKHQEAELVAAESGTETATTNDVGGGSHRGSLGDGDWIQLNGPFNLVNISSVSFRVADAAAGRTPGSPLAAIEGHQDAVNGPIVMTANLVSTGTGLWASQTFPISLSGTHELFLVFRTVTDGATGDNLFNLNWLEFNGTGIGVPP